MHILPWIRSRFTKSTRHLISTCTFLLIHIHSHDFLFHSFVSHEARNVFSCYVILIFIFFIGKAIRVTKTNLWLFSDLYMFHNIRFNYSVLYSYYISHCFLFSQFFACLRIALSWGLLGSFSSTSLIFCYYIAPNNDVAFMFQNNIVSQASYMHLKLLPTCDVYFLDIRAPRFWGVPSSNFG